MVDDIVFTSTVVSYTIANCSHMAEVIGLVSLSIQCCHLCEGLTKYYSDYRSYSKEINQIILETDELKSICQNIECELQRLPQIQVVVVQQIKRLIVSCESGIQNLSDTLGQCISTQLPTDFPIKLHSFRVRAAYPFKKRTLQTLRNNVQILRNNMQSALMILHL